MLEGKFVTRTYSKQLSTSDIKYPLKKRQPTPDEVSQIQGRREYQLPRERHGEPRNSNWLNFHTGHVDMWAHEPNFSHTLFLASQTGGFHISAQFCFVSLHNPFWNSDQRDMCTGACKLKIKVMDLSDHHCITPLTEVWQYDCLAVFGWIPDIKLRARLELRANDAWGRDVKSV